MSDESFIDVNSVLDRPEKWARESLRDDGYSDAFIDEWIQVDDGLDLEVALELITSEHDYKILLIRHIQYLRDQLSNGNQSPIDWIWDGFLIAWFLVRVKKFGLVSCNQKAEVAPKTGLL